MVSENVFPFDGYEFALDSVVRLSAVRAGLSVLDLGTGTGNLAKRFLERGCKLWCTDFSQAMLDKARAKLPSARLIRQDLRAAWPRELDRRFDRIASAYVFHHFDLDKKVALCGDLVTKRLAPGGKLIIADISFDNAAMMTKFANSVGVKWEAEPYWVADESVKALGQAGLKVDYIRVSPCAGIYHIVTPDNLHAGT